MTPSQWVFISRATNSQGWWAGRDLRGSRWIDLFLFIHFLSLWGTDWPFQPHANVSRTRLVLVVLPFVSKITFYLPRVSARAAFVHLSSPRHPERATQTNTHTTDQANWYNTKAMCFSKIDKQLALVIGGLGLKPRWAAEWLSFSWPETRKAKLVIVHCEYQVTTFAFLLGKREFLWSSLTNSPWIVGDVVYCLCALKGSTAFFLFIKKVNAYLWTCKYARISQRLLSICGSWQVKRNNNIMINKNNKYKQLIELDNWHQQSHKKH